MAKKILAVAGSPRKGGNSETLLDRVIRSAEEHGAEVKKIRVCDLKINGCLHCDYCVEHGECVQDDDMRGIYPEFFSADVILVATPMFFMNVPSQLKAFIDRFQCMWAKRFVLKQPLREDGVRPRGVMLAVGGTKGKSLFNGLDLLMSVFFDITDVGFDREASLYYRSIDGRGEIEKHETAMQDADALGRMLAGQ
ncbi:MAG TPA: flavodoxin family protein [bacterium]|nr:flavodoxin family protein [bacterium]